MRSHDWVLDWAETLIGHACQPLAGPERDERYREWTGELPAILYDPNIRSVSRRISRTLLFALDQHRTTEFYGPLYLIPLWITTCLIGGSLVLGGLAGELFFGFWSILADNLHGIQFLEVNGAWLGCLAVYGAGHGMFLGMAKLSKYLRAN